MLTDKDKELFHRLQHDREENAKVMKKRSMRGYAKNIIEKYSDLAHFIYELLQNADDAQATEATFILESNKLIYKHNGKVRFTITDVDREEDEDIGHINSITSIGNSNKEESEAKIGKFGVGFKAVFQYTNTPHIYDNFFFKIENLVVPILLDKDFPGREKHETVFVFPFDKPEKNPEKSYKQILKKLSNLSNPTLFLNNLKKITWQTENKQRSGSYEKKILSTKKYNENVVQEIQLIKKVDGDLENQKLYLFTKNYSGSNNLAYSIGYRVTEEDQVIYDSKISAYCFFETKEPTNLRFFINAPFLLNDSREGILEEQEWNQTMINYLAELTAESLPICRDLGLINDDFFNVLPITKEDFCNTYSSQNKFAPIYEAVLDKLKTDQLLPVNNGERFTHFEKAYLADGQKLIDLFNLPSKNKQKALEVLTGNNDAEWVFSTITNGKEKLWNYIKDNLVQNVFDSEKIARKINEEFIEKQTDSWLINFYSYLLDIPSLWRKGSSILRNKEIIRLEGDQLVSPFNTDNDLQAYLPLKSNSSSFPVVKQCFVENNSSLEFLKQLGLTKPDKKAEIYSILKKYEENCLDFCVLDNEILNDFSLLEDFEQFLNYFDEYNDQKFLDRLKRTAFLVAFFPEDYTEKIICIADTIYFKDNDLLNYFEGANNDDGLGILIFDQSFYQGIYSKYDQEAINRFLREVGIKKEPSIIEIDFDIYKKNQETVCFLEEEAGLKLEHKLDFGRWNSKKREEIQIKDYDLQGLENCLSKLNKDKSVYLWCQLLELEDYYQGYIKYTRHKKSYSPGFRSHFLRKLREAAWLYDKQGNVRRPSEVLIEDLADEYELDYSKNLASALGLLSQQQKEIQLRGLGVGEKLQLKYPALSDEEIYDIVDSVMSEKGRNQQRELTGSSRTINSPLDNNNQDSNSETPIDTLARQLAKGANQKAREKKAITTSDTNQQEYDEEIVEQDDYLPPPVDTEEQVKKLKDKLETEIAELNRKEALKNTVGNSDKYSFAWFKALLDLEYEATGENRAKKNPIQVKFNKVEWDTDSQEILVLSGATYIPYLIEDNGELSLTINFKNNSKSILVEALSPQKKILKAKLKDSKTIQDIDLRQIENAVIEVRNADFILENLRNAFKKLELADNYNLHDNLPTNIKFIFGPPGTGKTTHLVTEEILPKIRNSNEKILVLTPTNKAADVLTETIIKKCEEHDDKSYYHWLTRYGLTESPLLENTVFAKSKYLDTSILRVLTTTIARFPYDNFKQKNNNSIFQLRNFDWDYIIFDESSMISLASIMYVIYYVIAQNPDCKFIIAGDPFQLSPVIQEEAWKDSNIYSLVKLDQEDSFINPQTTPHQFEVVNLRKQYRSILQLGSLFSEFRYNGNLEHHRLNTAIKAIEIKNLLLKPLTIIKFKVSKFESLYKPRKIKGSSYQIYSAILTVELVSYILENIIELPEGETYRIGIICPYRIQRDIIDKLLVKISTNPQIELLIGTIHGFQGDECDMILNLLNPPLNISDKILLNKKNLLNVSISRAKDYLILFLPDDETGHLKTENLLEIETIKELIYEHEEVSLNYAEFNNNEIEQIIFGRAGVIEELSFATSHQSVNVYSNPDKKYEIRYDENAVDIQLRLDYETK